MDLDGKIAEAFEIVDRALERHLDDKELVGRCVLFSGGNDSTTLAHLFKNQVTHAVHCNTTIGVEETRQFVRDQCEQWGIPLLEEYPPQSFEELVIDQGFPGPAMHFKMYQRLKERGLRQARKRLVTNPRKQRVLFIAGRRRAESARRSMPGQVPDDERTGSIIWASPFANWTREDLDEYRKRFNVPRNPVADRLGMSGECLCGAFAEPGEFERIREEAPHVAEYIVKIEHACREAGAPEQRCQWGWGAYRADPSKQPPKTGPLCSSCDARFQHRLEKTEQPSPQLQAILERRQMRKAV